MHLYQEALTTDDPLKLIALELEELTKLPHEEVTLRDLNREIVLVREVYTLFAGSPKA